MNGLATAFDYSAEWCTVSNEWWWWSWTAVGCREGEAFLPLLLN